MAGIYIHIPFCKQACHYCDFHFSTSLKHKSRLLGALQVELRLRSAELKGEAVQSLYFGGGTPSILEIWELRALMDVVNEHYTLSDSPEITVEANPDDLSLEKLENLKQIGVNRLSIGVQSFFGQDLKLMNRAHNAVEAEQCLSYATQLFDNITLDLIYGMPQMDAERWLANIEKALSFNVPHISAYALTVEPQTALARFIDKGKMAPLNEAAAEKHYRILRKVLLQAGFENYEFSNFGKPGYHSKANTGYWTGKPYLGIGPSAHSYNGKHRSWNVAHNIKYCQAIEQGQLPSETEILTPIDRFNEKIMVGLRLAQGISLAEITDEFGTGTTQRLLEDSKKPIQSGLLEEVNGRLRVTDQGRFLTDGIASDLFSVHLD
ncbi:radical SAM family heme chaperone HemW [Sediminicola luteus]|uniref:Heme chaperone HemW n=1 Tax=Sediminicola luteus TaxID=319238 RepID=A0A2A4GG96_9FLAO|nr:radical SAM family heme chaperone HemW [Sediminicola luteus]PCE66762.1 coproporphyrinogen III oxidase [Sediminicola luteus]